jgi:hypothetical protein
MVLHRILITPFFERRRPPMMEDDFSQFDIESPETLIADEGIDEVHRLM